LLVVVYELKTQALPAPAANAVWWIAVLASVAFAVGFVLTLRRSVGTDAPDAAVPVLTRPAG
jgi:hypothetical protein